MADDNDRSQNAGTASYKSTNQDGKIRHKPSLPALRENESAQHLVSRPMTPDLSPRQVVIPNALDSAILSDSGESGHEIPFDLAMQRQRRSVTREEIFLEAEMIANASRQIGSTSPGQSQPQIGTMSANVEKFISNGEGPRIAEKSEENDESYHNDARPGTETEHNPANDASTDLIADTVSSLPAMSRFSSLSITPVESPSLPSIDTKTAPNMASPFDEDGKRGNAMSQKPQRNAGARFASLNQRSSISPPAKLPLSLDTGSFRPGGNRTVSSPVPRRHSSSAQVGHVRKSSKSNRSHLHLHAHQDSHKSRGDDTAIDGPRTAPMSQITSTSGRPPASSDLPLPPASLPTYLQLELSSERPSSLFIHRSPHTDVPYESSQVKLERLQDFLLLPIHLESTLIFGAVVCLDAWLFTFTILPLRFIKALALLGQSWTFNILQGLLDMIHPRHAGLAIFARRRQSTVSVKSSSSTPVEEDNKNCSNSTSASREGDCTLKNEPSKQDSRRPRKSSRAIRSSRSRKSQPSALSADHKADLLKGLLILASCALLMKFDASRMYHSIRGQAAIKLYVIYNVLEVCDRLFSALGQDVLECLFSKECLERKANGRSKVARPFWLFWLALIYNLVHSTTLFYQVITLNVAVNSYSNALLTLLMSNQFVEIKSTVFKKFEKDSLFQLTCADVVERFQLWLMLTIIASRNLIETGGLTMFMNNPESASSGATSGPNHFTLPKAFTILPAWMGQVLAPFLVVLGSEMLVDWFKHAYVTKFNNVKPIIYGRFLDVLAKDYYSNAFGDQNLNRRLGLPIIPLACLFIRASVQTYNMLTATYMPPLPLTPPIATTTSLDLDTTITSPATTEVLTHVDSALRRAWHLSAISTSSIHATIANSSTWSLASMSMSHYIDTLAPYILPMTAIFLIFLLFLSLKLMLGMALLWFSRQRYRSSKKRQNQSFSAHGRRLGGWGVVEIDETKRQHIYADDPAGAARAQEREAREREKPTKPVMQDEFGDVERYKMVGKRIW